MKVIIKHDLLTDEYTILDIFEDSDREKCINAIQADIRSHKLDEEVRITIHGNNTVKVHVPGMIWGKTAIIRYTVDTYIGENFAQVMREIEAKNEDEDD